MKVIITGATGFIGRNIAEKLHSNDVKVITTGRSEEVGQLLTKQGIEFVKADITKQNEINSVFSKSDFVIHCAARAGDWGNYSEFYDVNVNGTKNIINACKDNDIKRIIFISTPSVYYSGKDRYDIKENAPLPSKQFYYGKTKLIAEKELLSLSSEGFKTIVLRPRAVYGKYDNIIIPRILKLAENKKIPLINKGKALVDITYIDNLVGAVINCIEASENSWNNIYNISNGEPISLKKWFSLVLKVFNRPFNYKNVPLPMVKFIAIINEYKSKLFFGNKKPTMTRFSVGYMSKSMTMSIEKAKQKLKYSPKFSNKLSFDEYMKWYNLNKSK